MQSTDILDCSPPSSWPLEMPQPRQLWASGLASSLTFWEWNRGAGPSGCKCQEVLSDKGQPANWRWGAKEEALSRCKREEVTGRCSPAVVERGGEHLQIEAPLSDQSN